MNATMVAVMVEKTDNSYGVGWDVSPLWSGVDRPSTGGWQVDSQRMADRLVAALMAGAVLYGSEVRTDVNGRTYVSSRSRVMGKYMNADLKRLGF